jgi:hypothetical protein
VGWRGRLRIYLYDQCPRIGCGWRWVDAHVGRKRVRLKYQPTVTDGDRLPIARGRLRPGEFHELAAKAEFPK